MAANGAERIGGRQAKIFRARYLSLILQLCQTAGSELVVSQCGIRIAC